MATTENFHNGTGGTDFEYTFPALLDSDVKASVDAGSGFVATTAFTLLTSPTRVRFNTAPASGTNNVRIYRDTNVDTAKAIYAAGSSIRAADLNNNMDQVLYSAQEDDRLIVSTDIKDGEIIRSKIKNDAIDGTKIEDDAINSEHYADLSVDLQHLSANSVDSSKIVNGTIVADDIANTTITGGKLVNDTITATQIAANAITASELANNAVDTDAILSGAVVFAKMAANSVGEDQYINGSVKGDHIGNDEVNSQHLAAGSIDTEHIGNDQLESQHYAAGSIDLEHLAANSVGETQYIDGSVKAAHIGDSEINSQHYADGSIDSVHIGNDQIDSQHYAATSIDLEHLSANSVGENQYIDGSVKAAHIGDSEINSQHYADGSIDHEHLANDIIDGDNIQNNAIGSEHIAANAVTTSEIADAELTTLAGMQSGTASKLAGSTALTADIAELNLLDGKSVVTSVSGSSTDVQLPTAKAVNDQIVNLLNDTGGFKPIANEVSFPTTNPDPDDGAGTIVSIADVGGLKVADGSGSGTYAGTAGNSIGATTTAGVAVTITGIDTTLRGTTIAAGKGMLVQTTSTLNTYTYHRLVVDEAGVATAQSLVTSFNERYRTGSSKTADNHASNDDGDLFFDQGANKMYVYDGDPSSGGSWKEVTSAGEFKLLTVVADGTTSGTPTFNGPDDGGADIVSFDLRDGSNTASVTNVGQLIVSLNGVIQKPNEGSYSSSEEGYYLEGSNGIKFCTGPAANSSLFVTQIGSTVTLNEPANNSVSTIKIQNLAVDATKLAANAVTNVKIADDTIHETKLDIHQAPADGKFLKYTSSNGMEWGDVPAGVGGANGADFNDNVKIRFGHDDGGSGGDVDSIQGQLWWDETNNYFNLGLDTGSSHKIDISAQTVEIRGVNRSSNMAIFRATAGQDLFYSTNKKFETTSGGAAVSASNNGFSIGQVGHTGGNVRLDIHSATSGVGSLIRFLNDHHDAAYIGLAGDTTGNLIMHGGANKIEIKPNGSAAVELYHGTSKKFETYSNGFRAANNGNIKLASDSGRFYLGAGDDATIHHSGSHAFIENGVGSTYIRTSTSGEGIHLQPNTNEAGVLVNYNGSVELYYDGVKKFETASFGATVRASGGSGFWIDNQDNAGKDIEFKASSNLLRFNDSVKATFGTNDDLEIYHNGSDNYIVSAITNGDLIIDTAQNFYLKHGGEKMIQATNDAGVELYHNGVKKLETLSNGVRFLDADSNLALQLDTNGGTQGYIYADSNQIQLQTGGGETSVKCIKDAATELYYNNSKKFETNAEGVKISGHLEMLDDQRIQMGDSDDLQVYHAGGANYINVATNQYLYFRTNNTSRWSMSNDGHLRPEANNTYDIGSTSQRVRNLYTNDLNLSNEGSTNSVDGTWGNYTIQEGEDDLFLINRRSGKKYKFNLTEVN